MMPGVEVQLETLVLHLAEVLDPGLRRAQRAGELPVHQGVDGALVVGGELDVQPVAEDSGVEAALELRRAFGLQVEVPETADGHRRHGDPLVVLQDRTRDRKQEPQGGVGVGLQARTGRRRPAGEAS